MAESWTTIPLNDVSTSELVTAAQLSALGNNLRFLTEVNYTEFTAAVNVSAITVGTANQIVSSGAITYDAVPHMIEFYCPRVSSVNANCNVILRDGSTVIGTMAWLVSGAGMPALNGRYRVTPSAASHTYNIAAWNDAADTIAFDAGTGGAAGSSATFLPGFIRITRIPT